MPLADLLERLPTPIAIPLQSYLEETDPRQKLWALCDSVELLLRLLVFVGIADLARREGKPPQPLRAELRKLIERPTLGHWTHMAKAVAQTQATRTDGLVPELTPLVQRTLLPLLDGGGDRRTAHASLLDLRNFLAHAGGVTRASAETLLAAWREPFERAMESLAWLGEFELVAQGPDGYGCLRGPTPAPSPYTPRNLATVAEALALADAVAVVRGEIALPLWPLVLYGPPYNPYGAYPSEESVPQLYRRQEDIYLQYTPLGGVVCHGQAGDAALARFQELFHADREPSRTRPSRFTVRDFRDRIRGLADRLVGRTVELATLRGVLDATPEGVIWVAGTAGIGKSSLLARIAQDHLDAPPANTLVLPYWFDAGDERCQRETFLRFAIERLRDGLRLAPSEDGQESPKPLQQLRELLQRLDGRRALFVLDGLDEIAGRDPHFARDVPLALRLPGVVWLCGGRPEQGLPQLFRPAIAWHPFPDGLPPMREDDIRAMLLENLTPELRKRLVGQDRERGEQVINPFIASVTKAAHGLPLYVRLVINDIWAGRYRMLDAGERLPPSLNAYHEEHLRRCALSSLHQILTPMVALLAVVHEEPTAETLAALLRQRTLIPAGEAGLALVRDGLAVLESMVRRKRDEDGRVRYALHHHSLRQHIQESPQTRQAVETAREFLGDAALRVEPDAAAHYLYRYGIDHLVEENAGRHQDALRLLTRFDYLMARFHALRDTSVAADLCVHWQTHLRTGGSLDDEARIWEAFFRENEHILRRGDNNWPAYKILLQLAIEHADDSPITRQAEAWLAQPGNCDWVWLRNPCRPEHVPVNPVVRVFEGHADTVNGVTVLSDGRILSWSEDCTLRIWERDNPNVFIEMKGHTHAVTGAKELPDQKIVSCSNDGTLRFWDSRTGSFLEELYLNGNELSGVDILPNGKILFCTNDHLLKLIDIDGKILSLNNSSEHIQDFKVLSDNTIVSWNYQHYYCWDGRTGEQISKDENVLKNIREVQEGTEKLDDNVSEILNSLAEDFDYHSSLEKIYKLSDQFKILELGFGALWLFDCGNTKPVLKQIHNEKINGIKILSKNDVLIWEDKYVRILHISSDLPLIEYQEIGKYISQDGDKRIATNVRRHFAEKKKVRLLPNNRVLSWDYATIGIWDSNTGKSISVYLFNPTSDDVLSIVDIEVLINGFFLLESDYGYYLFDGNNFNEMRVRNLIHLPDQNFACTCIDFKNQLEIRCGTTGRVLKELKGHLKEIEGIESLPDGRILSWSKDSTLRLWNVETGNCIKVLEGHTDTVTGVYIRPDNRILSWSNDSTWRSWNATTGECITCIKVMEKHADTVTKTYLLSDEYDCILSISKDNTLCLWSSKTGNFIGAIKASGCIIEDAFELSNGNILVVITDPEESKSLHKELYLFNGKNKILIATLPTYSDEKIKILNDGNFLVWSNKKSDLNSRIINGFDGKILTELTKNDQFIKKLWILNDCIYFFLNDGTFGTIQINSEGIVVGTNKLSGELISEAKEIFDWALGKNMANPDSNDRAIKLLFFNIYWQADSVVVPQDRSDDGTYIVSAADGRVLCLKLYRGAKRITWGELADDHDDPRTR